MDGAGIVEDVLASSANRGLRGGGGRPKVDLDLLLHVVRPHELSTASRGACEAQMQQAC